MRIRNLWKQVSACFLITLVLLAAMPAIPAQAAASSGSFSYQRTNITYQLDSSYPAPYGSNLSLRRFYAYTVNQDNSGNLKQAYCIQYGVDVETGSTLSRQDDYGSFSAKQKELLNKALVFGYNESSGTKYGGTWEEETAATQALVWIISTGHYGTGDEARIVNGLLANNSTARSIYDKIRNNVADFDTIPSFAGTTAANAPKHELKYNMVNGKYELTLTDANKVLDYFDFSGSGVSFTRSGNKLTISTEKVLENATFTANKKLPRDKFPTLVNGAPEYWTHGTWQDLTSINVSGQNLQIPAVLKLETEKLGKVDLVKKSEDGIVAGMKFHIAGHGWERIVTTDSNGRFLIENLKAGYYTITELDVPNRYVVPKPQVVEVLPGRTTAVEFNNILKKFHIYITKSDTETGGTPQGDATLNGAVYEIYDSTGKLVDRFKAEGSTGKSKLLVLGTYTIYEVEPPTGYNLNEKPMVIHGDFEGQTVEIGRADTGIQDAVIKGQVMLAKFADKPLTGDPEDGGVKQPLEGIEFTFTLVSTGEVACKIVTDEDGFAMTPLLPYGLYRVEETKGKEGYRNIEPFDVMVDTHGKIYKYILENTVFESDVKIIKRDKETGKEIPLAGTTFKIKDSEGNWVTQKYNYPTPTEIDEFETAADGTLVLPQPLSAGNYWLYEIIAPHGYTVGEEPIPFTVSSDNQSVLLEVVAENMPVKGTVTIEKLGEYLTGFEETEDETYGTLHSPVYKVRGVPGTVYDVVAATDIVTPDGTVRAEAGSVVDTLTTGKDGRATSKELYLGQYQLVEKSVPTGFVLDETPIPFELTYENQHTAIVSENEWQQNERQKAAITLLKEAETLENQSYNPYPDIVFGLYTAVPFVNTKGETVLDKDALMEVVRLDETGTGLIQSDLPFSSYYVKELETSAGYYLSDQTFEFTLTHEDTSVPVVEITVNEGEAILNTLMRGKIIIRKSTEDGVIEGFTFRVTGTTVNGTPYEAEFDTDENGVIEIPGLPIGEYTVTEVATDKTVGYILPDSQTVTVKPGEESELAFENKLIRGGFKLVKVDAENGERLDGAVFGLYENGGDLLEEFTVKGGEYSMDGLLFGSYYLLEHKAPAGYELSDAPFPFTIANHEETIEITAENEKLLGGVRLTKTDADNAKTLLKGAVFELYQGDKLLGSYTTDAKGVITVENLAYGKYHFVEKTAPDGYELNTTPIKFTIDEKTTEGGTVLVEVSATNKTTPKEPLEPPSTSTPTPKPDPKPEPQTGKGDSPKTGDENNLLIPILLLVGAAAGLSVALVKRKKATGKRKQK